MAASGTAAAREPGAANDGALGVMANSPPLPSDGGSPSVKKRTVAWVGKEGAAAVARRSPVRTAGETTAS